MHQICILLRTTEKEHACTLESHYKHQFWNLEQTGASRFFNATTTVRNKYYPSFTAYKLSAFAFGGSCDHDSSPTICSLTLCVCVIIMTTPTSRDYDSAQEAAAVTTDHNNNFPSRLHHFLDVVDEYHLSHIASWLPHGRGFRIHDPKAFVTITAPRFVVAVVLSMARMAAMAILSLYIYPSNTNILSFV